MICVTDSVNVKCLVAPNRCEETQILTIGTAANSTNYWVYIVNEATGRKIKLATTSSVSGVVTIDLSLLAGILTPNNVYYLWVTLENVNITDLVQITIAGEQYDSFRIAFDRIFEGGVTIVPANQTLEVIA